MFSFTPLVVQSVAGGRGCVATVCPPTFCHFVQEVTGGTITAGRDYSVTAALHPQHNNSHCTTQPGSLVKLTLNLGKIPDTA